MSESNPSHADPPFMSQEDRNRFAAWAFALNMMAEEPSLPNAAFHRAIRDRLSTPGGARPKNTDVSRWIAGTQAQGLETTRPRLDAALAALAAERGVSGDTSARRQDWWRTETPAGIVRALGGDPKAFEHAFARLDRQEVGGAIPTPASAIAYAERLEEKYLGVWDCFRISSTPWPRGYGGEAYQTSATASLRIVRDVVVIGPATSPGVAEIAIIDENETCFPDREAATKILRGRIVMAANAFAGPLFTDDSGVPDIQSITIRRSKRARDLFCGVRTGLAYGHGVVASSKCILRRARGLSADAHGDLAGLVHRIDAYPPDHGLHKVLAEPLMIRPPGDRSLTPQTVSDSVMTMSAKEVLHYLGAHLDDDDLWERPGFSATLHQKAGSGPEARRGGDGGSGGSPAAPFDNG